VYDRGPSTASSFIWFNQNPGQNKDGKPFVAPYKLKWFTNQKFRQAISYGIDRQGIVKGVLFGRGAPLWGPESSANRKWFNPNVRQYPYNPQHALELLAEAGFKKDEKGVLRDEENHPVEFTLITNQENPLRQNIATIFMENMKALGIQVRLQFQDFGTFVGKIQDSFDYEVGMLGFTGGGDPVGGMSIYSSKGRLHQWHPNQAAPATPWEARMDELMTLQLKTLDENKRRQYYFEVQAIMSEQVPLIYLVTPNTYAGLKNRWQNLQIPPLGSVLWNLDSVWMRP
ncbi:MAG: ABC transporter substrate-binding protein, partial [bacterium]